MSDARQHSSPPAGSRPQAKTPAETASVLAGGETVIGSPKAGEPSPTVILSAGAAYPGLLAPAEAEGELGRLGGYAVLRELGRGGMGLVFEAEDPKLRRRVALKVMLPEVAKDPQARERFLREARSGAAVEHEHVVPVYQVGEDRGVPFLAMRLLPGESLADLLARKGALPATSVAGLGRQAALGLAAAHERGLIHRDVKPANLWVEPGGRVRVLDFGLARPTEASGELTRTGAVVGTPEYLAPEQLRGEELDARADLFSLGAVLYRAATGASPFRRETLYSTLKAVETEPAADPRSLRPDLPGPLADLILKLLEKDRKKRPASATAVAKLIKEMGPALAKSGEAVGPGPVHAAEGSPTIVTPTAVIDTSAPAAAGVSLAPTARPVPTAFPVFEPPPVLPSRVKLPPRKTTPRPQAKAARGKGPPWTNRNVLLAAGGGFLGLFGLVLAITLRTGDATVTIESFTKDVEVIVKQGGEEVVILDPETNATATLDPGTYSLTLKGGDGEGFTARLKENTITLSRGDERVVVVEKTPLPAKGEEPSTGQSASADSATVSSAGRSSAAGRWVALFDPAQGINPSRVSAPAGSVKVEGDALHIRGTLGGYYPDTAAKDSVVRARFEFLGAPDAGPQSAGVAVRDRSGRRYVLVVSSGSSYRLEKHAGGAAQVLAQGRLPSPIMDAKGEVAFAAVGDRIIGYVDGVKVNEVTDREYVEGGPGVLVTDPGGDCRVRNFQMFVLDGTGLTPERALELGPGGEVAGSARAVDLLAGGLVGWTALTIPEGAPAPKDDWTLRDGVLECATDKPTWLRYDRKLADFELDLEFFVPPNGNSGVLIRHSGEAPLPQHGMEVQVIDGEPGRFQATAVTGAIFSAVPASPPDAMKRGEWNRMTVLCRGERVQVTLNGLTVADAEMDQVPALASRPRSGHIGFYSHDGNAKGTKFRNVRLRELTAQAAAGGRVDGAWVSLFDGRSLAGWEWKGGLARFEARNGAIVGSTAAGSPNGYLCTVEDYGDFELEFEIKLLRDDLNSGVQIRSHSRPGHLNGDVHGPQVELEWSPGRSGHIYGEKTTGKWIQSASVPPDAQPTPNSAFKNGDWNACRVRAVGPRVATWINGEKIADVVNPATNPDDPGFVALQVHSYKGPHPAQVMWRNIRIRELAAAP